MHKSPHLLSTEYIKRIWDHFAMEDGDYGGIRVEDAGHVVNGLFIDDVYFEMQKRGEGRDVAV